MILSAKNYRQLLLRPGRYRDSVGEIRGLMLVVKNERSASWQLRYERNGRERWMGLGAARLIGLTEARARARAVRLQLLDGHDPLAAKQQAKAAAAAAALKKSITFEQAATAYHGQHADKWKNKRDAAQFLDSLREYAFPILGALPVNAIDTAAVLRVLERVVPARRGVPAGGFWATRPTTARRVRRRIENVLDWAAVRGYRSGDNPARWSGHLRGALPVNAKAARKHLPALPYAAVHVFISELSGSVAARTAARTGETLGATWDEIDLAAGVWCIPAARMKGNKVHRVPLSEAAVALLRALPREDGNRFVFIGGRKGAPAECRQRPAAAERVRSCSLLGFRPSCVRNPNADAGGAGPSDPP